MADYLSSLYFDRYADSCIITYSLNESKAFNRIVHHVPDVSMCNVSQTAGARAVYSFLADIGWQGYRATNRRQASQNGMFADFDIEQIAAAASALALNTLNTTYSSSLHLCNFSATVILPPTTWLRL